MRKLDFMYFPSFCLMLIFYMQGNPNDLDAEVRVNSVRSLVSVCEILICSKSPIFSNSEEESLLFLYIKNKVIQTLLKALDDYTVDNRGDVGSWVREAAINGLEKCIYNLCKKDSEKLLCDPTCLLFDANTASSIIGGFAKQGVEKLDKLREISIKALYRIFNNELCITSIPHFEAIKLIVPNVQDFRWRVSSLIPIFLLFNCNSLNKNLFVGISTKNCMLVSRFQMVIESTIFVFVQAPQMSFPCLVKLLQFSCYSKVVLSGLVISIGGLQDSLRKDSLAALLEYIQNSEGYTNSNRNDREYMLSVDLLSILKEYQKSDRVIIPTLKVS